MFEIRFLEGWNKFFLKLDNSEKEKIWKKIQNLKTLKKARHMMHGLPNFVIETGQYRICFRKKENIIFIIFAGNHKQYEKWFKTQ